MVYLLLLLLSLDLEDLAEINRAWLCKSFKQWESAQLPPCHSRFFIIKQSWQCGHQRLTQGQQKRSLIKNATSSGDWTQTPVNPVWHSPVWANMTLLVRLRVLGYLYSYDLLILAKLSES